jgi:NAD(P)-dependent dehydrogenase (short-subunit alcohol dehydrogenase family)
VARLEGKVAIITGAGSGIGRASALLFAKEGARVVCADVSGKQEDTAADIGANAVPVHANVASASDVEAMVRTAVDTWGRLDVLFNNAGFGHPGGPVHEIDEDTWAALIAVNLTGVFLGIKYAVPAMLASGGGSIISTASASGLVGWKGLGAYSAAKGGVVLLTKTAALDYATQGIRVNAIAPGMTFTGLAGADAEGELPAPDVELPFPMKRFGLPRELAQAALFLASDESSFITGVTIPVDGGYVAE